MKSGSPCHSVSKPEIRIRRGMPNQFRKRSESSE
jgi:hypothetical protein